MFAAKEQWLLHVHGSTLRQPISHEPIMFYDSNTAMNTAADFGTCPDFHACFFQQRNFHKFKSLKQRLHEVKQSRTTTDNAVSTGRQSDADNDDTSTVISETNSVVEAKLQQLLAAPMPGAASSHGPGGAAGGASSDKPRTALNFTVRR